MSNTIELTSNCCGSSIEENGDRCNGCGDHCSEVIGIYSGDYFNAHIEDDELHIEPYTTQIGDVLTAKQSYGRSIDKLIAELEEIQTVISDNDLEVSSNRYELFPGLKESLEKLTVRRINQ